MSAMGDIDEIKQVKYRYLRALDTKHWDEFADTLTEDVVGRYGESIGEEHHFTNRDELVTFMRSSLGPEILTEHRVTHPEITLDGDEASATGLQLHADRCRLLPRSLPSDQRGLEDQRDRLRPHLRRVHVDRESQFQGESWSGA
jgi:hypothetical protein